MARPLPTAPHPRFVCASCYHKDCSKCIDIARLKLIQAGVIDEPSARICKCHNKTHAQHIAAPKPKRTENAD